MAKGDTTYSKRIPGDTGNYGWAVRFDKTDRYIGIDQENDDGESQRVLLSPGQVRELVKFVVGAS